MICSPKSLCANRFGFAAAMLAVLLIAGVCGAAAGEESGGRPSLLLYGWEVSGLPEDGSRAPDLAASIELRLEALSGGSLGLEGMALPVELTYAAVPLIQEALGARAVEDEIRLTGRTRLIEAPPLQEIFPADPPLGEGGDEMERPLSPLEAGEQAGARFVLTGTVSGVEIVWWHGRSELRAEADVELALYDVERQTLAARLARRFTSVRHLPPSGDDGTLVPPPAAVVAETIQSGAADLSASLRHAVRHFLYAQFPLRAAVVETLGRDARLGPREDQPWQVGEYLEIRREGARAALLRVIATDEEHALARVIQGRRSVQPGDEAFDVPPAMPWPGAGFDLALALQPYAAGDGGPSDHRGTAFGVSVRGVYTSPFTNWGFHAGASVAYGEAPPPPQTHSGRDTISLSHFEAGPVYLLWDGDGAGFEAELAYAWLSRRIAVGGGEAGEDDKPAPAVIAGSGQRFFTLAGVYSRRLGPELSLQIRVGSRWPAGTADRWTFRPSGGSFEHRKAYEAMRIDAAGPFASAGIRIHL